MAQMVAASSATATSITTKLTEPSFCTIVEGCVAVIGFSLLSGVANSYSAFFFVPLKPWDDRTAPDEQYAVIRQRILRGLARSSRSF